MSIRKEDNAGHGGVGVLCINGIDLLEKYPIKDSQMGLDSGGT